jgi:GT2 family glycosyltransferase
LKKRADLIIGIPLTDYQISKFFVHWLQMQIPLDVPVLTVEGAYVEGAHNWAIHQALDKYDFKAFTWIENDTLPFVVKGAERSAAAVYPRLLTYKEPIVGALYFSRRRPIIPIGFMFDEEAKTARHYTDAETLMFLQKPGIYPTGSVPMGCTTIKREVFEAFPGDEPWYDVPTSRNFDGNGAGVMTDDTRFCVRARQLGFPIHLDSQILCGHVGPVVHDERLWLAEAQATGRLTTTPAPSVAHKPKLEVVRR